MKFLLSLLYDVTNQIVKKTRFEISVVFSSLKLHSSLFYLMLLNNFKKLLCHKLTFVK